MASTTTDPTRTAVTTETADASALAGLEPGTWTVDPAHSEIAFTVRHLMTKVRGSFTDVTGEVVIAERPEDSRASAEIRVDSVDTRNAQRDGHIRSAEILDLETYPTLRFASTGVRDEDGGWVVDGELTVRDVTRQVRLDVEFNGTGTDPWGGTRAGFSATTAISRRDYGVEFNIPLQGDRALLGDKVDISLEVQLVHQQPEQQQQA